MQANRLLKRQQQINLRGTCNRDQRKRISIPGALLCAGVLAAATISQAADDNENTNPTAWWMISSQTAADVQNTINSNGARISNLKYDNLSPYPFTVTYVQNRATYA